MEVTKELIKNTMDLLAAMAAADIAETLGISNTQALSGFLASRTAQLLYDEQTKLWWDGPAAIAQMYEKEITSHGRKCAGVNVL